MEIIKETAHAKINLSLDVLKKRPDGYHEVRMVMQSISLADILTFSKTAQGIEMTCTNPHLPLDENNLVYKAASIMLKDTGYGVKIHLEKNIPLEAGMAGGSTDAAAVLRGLNRLYDLQKSYAELHKIALLLGADVPFCLKGGTALAEGIGEILTPLPSPPVLWLVVVKPPFGMSTALVYRSLKVDEIRMHPDTAGMVEALQTNKRLSIIEKMANVLEEVTLKIKPELIEIKNTLAALGAEKTLMSGSGPTIFGVFSDQKSACQAAKHLKADNYFVYVAYTLSEGGEAEWKED